MDSFLSFISDLSPSFSLFRCISLPFYLSFFQAFLLSVLLIAFIFLFAHSFRRDSIARVYLNWISSLSLVCRMTPSSFILVGAAQAFRQLLQVCLPPFSSSPYLFTQEIFFLSHLYLCIYLSLIYLSIDDLSSCLSISSLLVFIYLSLISLFIYLSVYLKSIYPSVSIYLSIYL